MLFEFILRAVSLDIIWLAGLVMNNLFLLFAFASFTHIFFGRRIIAGIVILSIYSWAWINFNVITGTVLLVSGFMMLNYMSRLAIVSFSENSSPWFKKKLVLVTSATGIIVFLVYNFLLR